MVDRARMLEQLVLHEGLKLTPYKDTEGNVTIGIGYNVTARGYDALEHVIGRAMTPPRLTVDEARRMCLADVDRIEPLIIKAFPEYQSLSEVRQRVCLDMAFNMGYRALGFNRTILAMRHAQWSVAARELHKSKWAGQVGERASRLAKMLLTNLDYVL